MPHTNDAATRAVQRVVEALRSQGNEFDSVLVQLDFAVQNGTWDEVVAILEHLAGGERDPRRAAAVHDAIARVCLEALGDAGRAVHHLDLALDREPGKLEAFEALDEALTRSADRQLLEASNRKMLERLRGAEGSDLEAGLWRFLAEVYRTRTKGAGKIEDDAATIRLASRSGPTSLEPHKILAELYLGVPGRWEAAVEEHQLRIREDPSRIDSYKALRRIYFDSRQHDKAWCLCGTLIFLEKADPEERQFFEQHKVTGMGRAQARLDNERWIKDLFHADEDPYVGKIFETILPAVRRFKVAPHKAFGLKKKDKHDPMTSTITFAKTFAYVAQVLNLPFLPELYLRPDQATALQYAITDPPASVVGQYLLSGFTVQDLTFEIGRHLAYYRGEHYIRWSEPTIVGLRLLLLAAMKAADPTLQTPPDPTGVLDQTVGTLARTLSRTERKQLAALVQTLVQSKDEADVEKWINAVELTACRAGFLLCNDLGVAARMIRNQATTVGDVPVEEKIKELIRFSVSEPYFRLRESLGITIGV